MFLALTTIAGIVVFVITAFALRSRMRRAAAIYEARTKTLQSADAVLAALDACALEREICEAAQTSSVMRSNQMLFRTLWPQEFDAAYYGAQRFIAQANTAALRG